MNNIKFTKSLKFKATVWYSGLLLAFSVLFIVVMNIFVTQYMLDTKPFSPGGPWKRVARMHDVTPEQEKLLSDSRENDLDNIRLISLYSLVPLILGSFAVGYLVADRTLKPLEMLSEEMENKQFGDLDREIELVDNGDEISSLIKSFNSMSRRLGEAFKSQKEFVENASHEIKTPLAVIQANLDSILEDEKLSKSKIDGILDSTRQQVVFMNKLTEDLLLLSALETEIKMEKINMRDVLDSAVADAKMLVKSKKFAVKVKGAKEVEFTGNSVLLQRAFQNILENSIKYSGGSELVVELNQKSGKLSIVIKDDGKGIPKSLSEKIFERFYRVDRSRTKSKGGNGLGLSITKEILERHGLRIRLGKSSKGTAFVISR